MTKLKNIIISLVVFALILVPSLNTFAVEQVKEYNIDINQTQNLGNISPQMYGINGFGALVLDWGKNPKYIENLKFMNPKNIRFHDNIQTDAVRNWRAFGYEDGKTWARWKLNDFADMIKLWRKNGINADITITIAHFPSWMKKYSPTHNGKKSSVELLDPSEFDNYAKFLADLVKILNVDLKLGINKFEIGNELDSIYSVALEDNGFPRRMGELATIYNKTSNKMREIDRNIKIGGPSLTRADRTEGIKEFVTKLKELGNRNLDFFSYHTYVSGQNTTTNEFINERITGNIRSFTRTIRSLLNSNGFGNTSIILNEFNISWTDQTIDSRMTNQSGAVFDALAYIESAKEGIAQISPWADKDNVYGKMDDNYNRRPGSVASKIFSTFVKGSIIGSSNNIPNFSTLTYKNNNRLGSVMVNYSKDPINVKIKGWMQTKKLMSKYEISADGKNMIRSAISFNYQTAITIPSNGIVLIEDNIASVTLK